MSQKINLLSPVGRIVMGSLYEPNTKDADGNPLVVKSGPNMGQPRVNYFFALAIPKNPGETHWAQTAWGQQIYAVGTQAFPQAAQSPAFAWKIEDGDSQLPNKKGRKPCDNEGWKGNWIIKFSGGFAPKVYEQQGKDCVINTTKDFVKPGYFVEVAFSCEGNGSAAQPGIYLNHQMLCFRAYGQEIVFGPDPNSVGFGATPLPNGASATPLPGGMLMPQVPGVVPNGLPPTISGAPGIPTPTLQPATTKQMTPKANGATYESFIAQGWTDEMMIAQGFLLSGSAPPSVPTVPVIPNVNFLKPKIMTPKANGATYESFIAQGWTDEMMVQQGMMQA